MFVRMSSVATLFLAAIPFMAFAFAALNDVAKSV